MHTAAPSPDWIHSRLFIEVLLHPLKTVKARPSGERAQEAVILPKEAQAVKLK